ncbi:hypothetical protein M8J77_018611 [Diaphorina citri]|nr:hypothetical protein M8J77_018611 [Diaphorina citri]
MSKILHYSEGIVTKKNIFESLNAVNPETNELKNPPQPPAKKNKPRKKKPAKSNKDNKENSEVPATDKKSEIQEKADKDEKTPEPVVAEVEEKQIIEDVDSGDNRNEIEESSAAEPEKPEESVVPPSPSPAQSPSHAPTPTEEVEPVPADPVVEEPSPQQPTPGYYQTRIFYPTMQFVNSSLKRGRGRGRGVGREGREAGYEQRPGRGDRGHLPHQVDTRPPVASSSAPKPEPKTQPNTRTQTKPGPKPNQPNKPADLSDQGAKPKRDIVKSKENQKPTRENPGKSNKDNNQSEKPRDFQKKDSSQNKNDSQKVKDPQKKDSLKEAQSGSPPSESKKSPSQEAKVKSSAPNGAPRNYKGAKVETKLDKPKSVEPKQSSPKPVEPKAGDKTTRASEEKETKSNRDVIEAVRNEGPKPDTKPSDQQPSGYQRGRVEEHSNRPPRDRNSYGGGRRYGRGEERDRGYSGQRGEYGQQGPRKYYDGYTDGSSGGRGYRRSFHSDGHPPPRRSRGVPRTGQDYENGPSYGQNGPSYGQNGPSYGQNGPSHGQNGPSYGQQNGYLSSEEDRRGATMNGDISNSNARNKRRERPNGRVNRARTSTNPSSRDPNLPEDATVDGTGLLNGGGDSGPRDKDGNGASGTRDKDGKTKKWSDESWQDDAPRKPSPYEEQTNRVKVTHEPVEIAAPENQMIQEVQGDIMAAPVEYSLGIGVSEDFRMPTGLPAQFRNEFRRLDTLLDQNCKVGDVAILSLAATPPRHIFYLITKKLSPSRPTLKALRSCLAQVRKECERLGVRNLALPQLGAGQDRLDWREVRPVLDLVFERSDIHVLVYMQNEDQEIDTKSQKAKNTGAKLVIEQKPVVEIEDYTSIIVFTSCDGALNATQLHSLNAKFNIQAELETQLSNASVGSIISLKRSTYFIILFIVSESRSDPIRFEAISRCLTSYKKHLHKDYIEYVAFEALADRTGTEMLNEKLLSFMKNSLPYNIQLHVCWPSYVEDRHFVSRTKPANGPRIENGRYHGNANSNAPSNYQSNAHSNAYQNANRTIEIDSNRHFPKL